MNCDEVRPFVSALHDGESVPREAAEHMRSCPACQARLEDYARMDVELRLLANSAPEEAEVPHLPQLRRRWGHTLTARVLVPRFALGVGLFAILGLSVGLGWMRAQVTGLWFQFDVGSQDAQGETGKWGSLLQAGDHPASGYLPGPEGQRIVCQVKATEVQKDVVRLEVKARLVPRRSPSQSAGAAGAVAPEPKAEELLAHTQAREFQYVPGKPLEVPVEGGSKVVITGRVYGLRPSFPETWYPVTPRANQIVLSKAALVQGNEFLGEIVGGGSANGPNPAVAICVPRVGALVFALKPFEGAVEGTAEFGQVHFTIDGQAYILFSATPITGGEQPRGIWVYRAPGCPPSSGSAVKTPSMIGSGDVTSVLGMLRK